MGVARLGAGFGERNAIASGDWWKERLMRFISLFIVGVVFAAIGHLLVSHGPGGVVGAIIGILVHSVAHEVAKSSDKE